MPSVYVSWSGQCRDAETRQALCNKLSDIAWSQRLLLNARVAPGHDLVEIRSYNHTLCGPVALRADLLPAAPTGNRLTPLAENFFSLRETIEVYGIEFSLPTIYHGDDRVSFVFLVDEDPALDGILVHVAQRPRPSLVVSMNVIHEQDPESGRRRVSIGDDRRGRQEVDAIEATDWVLVRPRVHVRYAFESWLDDLLGWIKHFYIPDLWFWRYEDLP